MISNAYTCMRLSLFIGTFDIPKANYSINSECGVCVECELVPWTRAQGCHVELDCDDGDTIEQDFFTSGLTSASGCLMSALSTPASCTLLFYDIEQDGSVSSSPAFTFDNVLVSEIVSPSTHSPSSCITMGMATSSTPSETCTE